MMDTFRPLRFISRWEFPAFGIAFVYILIYEFMQPVAAYDRSSTVIRRLRERWVTIPAADYRGLSRANGTPLKILLSARLEAPLLASTEAIVNLIGLDRARDSDARANRQTPPTHSQVYSALRRLQDAGLASVRRVSGRWEVNALEAISADAPLRMPRNYWRRGWIRKLSGAATLVLLTGLSQHSYRRKSAIRSGTYFLLPANGSLAELSRETTTKVLKELEDERLIHIVQRRRQRWAVFTDPELLGRPRDTVRVELRDKTRVYLTGTQFRAFSKVGVDMKRLPE